MSDTSQGPGWWQASDGKWYPPEQAPGGGATSGGGGGAVGTLDTGAASATAEQVRAVHRPDHHHRADHLRRSGRLPGRGPGPWSRQPDRVVLSFVSSRSASSWLPAPSGSGAGGAGGHQGRDPEPSMLFETKNLGPVHRGGILVSLLSFVVCCCAASATCSSPSRPSSGSTSSSMLASSQSMRSSPATRSPRRTWALSWCHHRGGRAQHRHLRPGHRGHRIATAYAYKSSRDNPSPDHDGCARGGPRSRVRGPPLLADGRVCWRQVSGRASG